MLGWKAVRRQRGRWNSGATERILWEGENTPGGPYPLPGEKEEENTHLLSVFWRPEFFQLGWDLTCPSTPAFLKPVEDIGRQLAGVKGECDSWQGGGRWVGGGMGVSPLLWHPEGFSTHRVGACCLSGLTENQQKTDVPGGGLPLQPKEGQEQRWGSLTPPTA